MSDDEIDRRVAEARAFVATIDGLRSDDLTRSPKQHRYYECVALLAALDRAERERDEARRERGARGFQIGYEEGRCVGHAAALDEAIARAKSWLDDDRYSSEHALVRELRALRQSAASPPVRDDEE